MSKDYRFCGFSLPAFGCFDEEGCLDGPVVKPTEKKPHSHEGDCGATGFSVFLKEVEHEESMFFFLKTLPFKSELSRKDAYIFIIEPRLCFPP
jgi:hypothetical protein